MDLALDVATGHKTGFYLDQRDNRHRLATLVRQLGCRSVLNTYCYTGGFSVAALAGGAQQVVSVDSSGPALALAQDNLRRNGFDPAAHEFADADVNVWLRQALQAGRRFDAIVLDPPKFAPTAAHAERAARAYKDINRLALMLLAPGGLLLSFSCSGGISADLFHKIVAGAGIDALGLVKAPGSHPEGGRRAESAPGEEAAIVRHHPHRLARIGTAARDAAGKHPRVAAQQRAVLALAQLDGFHGGNCGRGPAERSPGAGQSATCAWPWGGRRHTPWQDAGNPAWCRSAWC